TKSLSKLRVDHAQENRACRTGVHPGVSRRRNDLLTPGCTERGAATRGASHRTLVRGTAEARRGCQEGCRSRSTQGQPWVLPPPRAQSLPAEAEPVPSPACHP